MSSPRCPRCLRRLYDGATQAAHEASGACRLIEPEPYKHPRKPKRKGKWEDE